MLSSKATTSVVHDEQRVDRQQQLVGAARHDHGCAAACSAGRRPRRRLHRSCAGATARWRRLGPAAAASARRSARAPARGARRRASARGLAGRCGRSPSRPCGRPSGTVATAQAGRIDAVDAAGGQHVADLHVGVAGHEAHLQQAAVAAARRRTRRCARRVRVLSTGIAASRSVSSVTSDDSR